MNFLILKGKKWSLEEDIKLLEESIKTPKKWTIIAKKFVSRNCHQVKNRFICLMAKELDCKKEKIRQFINENALSGPITAVLKKISQS